MNLVKCVENESEERRPDACVLRTVQGKKECWTLI